MQALQNLPFKVGHLLYFSRIFVPPIPESEGEAMQQETNKRRKPSSGMPAATQESYYPYHVEDEVIAEVGLTVYADELVTHPAILLNQYATSICDFDFTNEPEPTNKPRRDDAFGVAEQGRLMLIPVDKLSALVERLDKEGV